MLFFLMDTLRRKGFDGRILKPKDLSGKKGESKRMTLTQKRSETSFRGNWYVLFGEETAKTSGDRSNFGEGL